MGMDGSQVERGKRFILELAMLEHRSFSHSQLCHRIGQIRGVCRADIGLHDGCLAALFGDDEISRVRSCSRLRGSRDVQEMNRFLDHFTLREKNKSAILKECAVKRGKSVVLLTRVMAKMLFKHRRVTVESTPKTGNYNAVRRRRRRKIRSIMPVYEHQPMSRHLRKCKAGNRLRADIPRRGTEYRVKRQFRDRRHIGKTPILVVDGWKSLFGELGYPRFAQWEQPGRLFGFFLEPLEFLEVWFRFLHNWV